MVVAATPLAFVVALAFAEPKVNVTVAPEIGIDAVVSVSVALTLNVVP
jgi:hypothetical protein